MSFENDPAMLKIYDARRIIQLLENRKNNLNLTLGHCLPSVALKFFALSPIAF
jgi:hypothetical protein